MRPSFSAPVQAERSKISSSQTKFQKSIDKGICLCYNIICLENRIAELCKGSTADYAYRACGILPCEEIKVSLSLQRNAHQGANPERQTLFFFLFYPSRRLGISLAYEVRRISSRARCALVSHHASACIFLRLDDIQCYALMIYRNKLRIIYKAYALIYLQKCGIIDSPINMT
jgi:hypothetical protein